MTKPEMPPSRRVQESWRRHARYEFLLETGELNMWTYNRRMILQRRLRTLLCDEEAA